MQLFGQTHRSKFFRTKRLFGTTVPNCHPIGVYTPARSTARLILTLRFGSCCRLKCLLAAEDRKESIALFEKRHDHVTTFYPHFSILFEALTLA